MPRFHLSFYSLWPTAAVLLAACGTPQTPSAHWQEVGLSGNANVRHAVDVASIRRQGDLALFRDRKTVTDPAQEHQHPMPPYKVALGQWEIDCRRHTFRLLTLQLLDARGQTLAQYQYTAQDLPARPIVAGSAAAKQQALVCR